MAKFYGPIGFVLSEETDQDVWTESAIEKDYYGDILSATRRYQASSDKTSDDVDVSNRISILANDFAYQNSHAIKYVFLMGTRWKVTSIDIEYPRLILSIGGVYNGRIPESRS